MLRLVTRQTGKLPDPADITEAARIAMTESVERMFRRAFINLSGRIVRSRSGRTARGLRARVAVQGNVVVGAVQSTWFVGRILEAGSPPREIIPFRFQRGRRRVVFRPGQLDRQGNPIVIRRRGAVRALRFQIGGRTVFATSVQHPGTRPRPWASTALQESEKDIAAAFERELRRVLGESDRLALAARNG